jgi:hypothetical protein
MKGPLLLILVLLLCASLGFGQIGVTGTQNPNLQPDQIVFSVSVTSPIDDTLDDIIANLKGTGITAANFNNLGSVTTARKGGGTDFMLQWVFSLPVPLANTKSTAALLAAAQADFAKNKPGLTLSFTTQGTSVSPEQQQSQSCTYAGLVADARAQARKVAAATGLPLGAIVSLSANVAVTNPGSGLLPAPTYMPSCILPVRFATDASTVTGLLSITTTRTLTVRPDQVNIGIFVTAAGTVTLDDVVALLKNAGVTVPNIANSYTVPGAPGQNFTQWTFSLNLPFSKLKDTLTALAGIQPTGVLTNLSYGVQGLQISPELQAAQTCPLSALAGDAQDQGRKLAAAAGVTLGALTGAFNGSAVPQSIPVAASRQGDFSQIYDPLTGPAFLQGVLSINPYFLQPACSLTLQFKLGS